MSAFKVGDRVHVEFDGLVSHIGSYGAIGVAPDGHPSRVLVNVDLATKLPTDEPTWADGDAIRVAGESMTYTLIFGGALNVWHSHTGSRWHPATISEHWRAGNITPLVPAVKS